MRILTVGAGAVGGFFGARLANAGQDVSSWSGRAARRPWKRAACAWRARESSCTSRRAW